MARPTRTLLSRDIIGAAAIELVESGAQLQVMPLAKKLGVSVSSIYHHVPGRTGIIKAMRDTLSHRAQLAIPPHLGWEDTIKAYTDSYRNMFAPHPRVLLLLLTVELNEPEPLDMYTRLMDALVTAGHPKSTLLTTIEVIDAFIFGVVLDALSPETIFDPDVDDDELAALVAAHPRGAARNTLVYDTGLELLIAGIRSKLQP